MDALIKKPLRYMRELPFSALRQADYRGFSSATRHIARPDPAKIAEELLTRFSPRQTFVRKQLLDANQLRLLGLTLNRPYVWDDSESLEERAPVNGTPLPPGYHLIYFTPTQPNESLGADGTDASFNPVAPFTRRMWAGGSCSWPGAKPTGKSQSLLRVGDTVTEITRILRCEPKVQRTGQEMLVMTLEKEFRNSKDELCLVDTRNWVFRPALDPSEPAPQVPRPPELSATELENAGQDYHVRHYNRDELVLFRFSALTFNAHRIHYDMRWATVVEGHRGLVVHGPLNFLSMLDLWRDEVATIGKEIVYPERIDYRAVSPIYAGEPYRVLAKRRALGEVETELQVVSNDGTVCMKGMIMNWS